MSNSSASPVLVQFEPGELIFSAGDAGDEAYMIETGQIEVFIETGEQPLSIRFLGPGDVLGEMAVIDAAPRSASARAQVATQCIVISSQQIAERISESDPVVRLLVTTLLKRMRSLTSRPNIRHFNNNHPDSNSAPLDDTTTAASASSYAPGANVPDVVSASAEAVIDKIRLESELRRAIESDDLMPYYQPLVDLQTGEIVGFELLVRWHSSSRGPVSPGIFIAIAEETSLIIPVGCWALKSAVQAIQTFQQQISQPLFISVNISARQFLSVDFIQELRQLVPPQYVNNIKLEVTESILMAGDIAIQTLRSCRKMGFHISLDDFGTGFSGLSYLSNLEVDSLKVDQAFVRKMIGHTRTCVLVKTILAMAQDLEMGSVAEGIETPEQRDLLKSLGCHIGQGYLFSPPVAFADARALLAGWQGE